MTDKRNVMESASSKAMKAAQGEVGSGSVQNTSKFAANTTAMNTAQQEVFKTTNVGQKSVSTGSLVQAQRAQQAEQAQQAQEGHSNTESSKK